MVIMFGAMFIAASMPDFFAFATLTYVFVGYVIMRLALVVLWLRAGRANPAYRTTAWRYASGQLLLQGFWAIVIFGVEPGSGLFFGLFCAEVVGELFVPWFAEQAKSAQWHRHHIIERFGLLNIIVIGETLLSSTTALEQTYADGFDPALLLVPLAGSVIAFAMWWLYFSEADHLQTMDQKRSFVWGYGHFVVFASGAAVGAGLGVLIDLAASGHGDSAVGGFSVSMPTALYIAGLWLLRDRYMLRKSHAGVLLLFAALVAATGWLPYAPAPTAIILVTCLVVRLRSAKR